MYLPSYKYSVYINASIISYIKCIILQEISYYFYRQVILIPPPFHLHLCNTHTYLYVHAEFVAIKLWMVAISCLSDRLKLVTPVIGGLLIFSLGNFHKIAVNCQCVSYPLSRIHDYRVSCIKTVC